MELKLNEGRDSIESASRLLQEMNGLTAKIAQLQIISIPGLEIKMLDREIIKLLRDVRNLRIEIEIKLQNASNYNAIYSNVDMWDAETDESKVSKIAARYVKGSLRDLTGLPRLNTKAKSAFKDALVDMRSMPLPDSKW